MLDVEQLRSYCLSKLAVADSLPFDDETLVFKVMDKMFALMPLEAHPLTISLKCDPDRAIELRAQYDGIITGAYHMNKKHWNSVIVNGYLPDSLVTGLIDHSYDLIVSKLKKSEQLILSKQQMPTEIGNKPLNHDTP